MRAAKLLIVLLMVLCTAASAQITGPRSGITDNIDLPRQWTTATRPANPRLGQYGFNTTTNVLEYWSGSSWSSPSNGMINVLSFSGVKNDGTGNVSPGVNAAIQLATSSGIHTVYFPPGTYRVDMSVANNAIVPASNVELLGAGVGQSILFFDDTNGYVSNGIISRTAGGWLASLSNFAMRQLTFKGNAGDGTTPFTVNSEEVSTLGSPNSGNQFTCNDIYIENVEYIQIRAWALVIKSCNHVVVRDSNFFKIPKGAIEAWGDNDVLITGNNIRYTGDDSISCQMSDQALNGANTGNPPPIYPVPPVSTGCTITNNTITEAQGVRTIGSRQEIFQHNVLRRIYGTGVSAQGSGTNSGCCTSSTGFSTIITNNVINDAFEKPQPSCGGCTRYNGDQYYVVIGGGPKQVKIPSFGTPGSIGLQYNANTVNASNSPGGGAFKVSDNTLVRTLPPHLLQLNVSADTTSGSTLTFTSTTSTVGVSVADGMLVQGTNIPAGTTVSSHTGTTAVLSNSVSGTVTNGSTITFTNAFSLSTTATAPINTSVLTFANANGVVIGNLVFGTSIPANTTVTAIASTSTTSATVTLSNPITAQINSSASILFGAKGQYSDWGYDPKGLWICWFAGGVTMTCGYDQAPVTETLLQTAGVEIVSPLYNSIISDNVIAAGEYGIFFNNGVTAANSYDYDGLAIKNNKISDCVYGNGCILWNYGGATYQKILITDNEIDGDPRIISTNRGANGTWVSNGSPPFGINLNSSIGGQIIGNAFRNLVNPVQGGTNTFISNNRVYGIPVAAGCSSSNGGVMCIPLGGAGYQIIHEDPDPGSTTYGEILSNNSLFAQAMPSSGTWMRGTFVTNTLAVCGGAAGWQRLTTGSGNTLNTDWQVVQATCPTLFGSLPVCSATTQGWEGFVTDQSNAVSYHSAAAGTGGTKQHLVCDGTNWIQD